jgi:hypothetical protein
VKKPFALSDLNFFRLLLRKSLSAKAGYTENEQAELTAKDEDFT